jgi:hypothetical protein
MSEEEEKEEMIISFSRMAVLIGVSAICIMCMCNFTVVTV